MWAVIIGDAKHFIARHRIAFHAKHREGMVAMLDIMPALGRQVGDGAQIDPLFIHSD